MRRAKRKARRSRLRLTPKHSAAFRKFASILELRPEDFLGWQLDDLLKEHDCPRSGLLLEWATGQIRYPTAEIAARVKARVADYLKSRELAADGKESA